MIFALGHLRIISTISKNDIAHFQQGIQSIARLIKIIKNIYLLLLKPCQCTLFVERSGSGVELRTLDYENPGSNPGCGVKTLGKFFYSTLLQFTQLNQ